MPTAARVDESAAAADASEAVTLEICRALPKPELHAHLHGSIRPSTLLELLQAQRSSEGGGSGGGSGAGAEAEAERLLAAAAPAGPAGLPGGRSLHDCFQIFSLIHTAVRDSAAVSRITREVLDDFAADGVTYLELRTTPRALADGPGGGAAGEGAATTTVTLPPGTRWLDPTVASVPVDAALNYYVYTVAAAMAQWRSRSQSRSQSRLQSSGGAGGGAGAQATTDAASATATASASAPPPAPQRMVSRLLLSINRTGSIETARRIAELARVWNAAAFCPTDGDDDAVEAACPLVVGMEVSGDPTRGSWGALLPVLEAVRTPTTVATVSSSDGSSSVCSMAPLRVSVHCGETMNVRETEAVLDWGPDRLGHMCVLAPATLQRLLASTNGHSKDSSSSSGTGSGHVGKPLAAPIPIEICPTSNALTLHLPSLAYHPTLTPWLASGYPFSLCTDDTGVFNITLSSEYAAVAATHGLSRSSLAAIAVGGFRQSFATPALAATLTAAAVAQCERLGIKLT